MLRNLLRRARHRDRPLGQSLVEFALLLPVLLLIVMVGLDFGRVYLGWINVQNMARIAANYAANNPDAWGTPGDAAVRARYEELITNDARAINCDLVTPIPVPVFPTGTELGDHVRVDLDCNFTILTPVISSIIGSNVAVSSSLEYPIKAGIVGSVPGGAPPVPAPVASFTVSPTGGMEDLEVIVTDTSSNTPSNWTWNWGDGTPVQSGKNPGPHVYDAAGTYTIELEARNTGGFTTATATVEVVAEPTTPPIARFTATPRTGQIPPGLNVTFDSSTSTGATTWLWDFGDGFTASIANPSHTYNTSGSYDVSLTVSDGVTSHEQVKTDYIIVSDRPCTVPNFAGTKVNNANGTWHTAGFITNVTVTRPPNGNYTIGTQSLPGGLTNPPGGCNAAISVGP